MHVRDVEQAQLHRLETLAELADRAAIGLGPFDLVASFLRHAVGDARNEEDILDRSDPQSNGRVPCADLQLEGRGLRRAAAHHRRSDANRCEEFAEIPLIVIMLHLPRIA